MKKVYASVIILVVLLAAVAASAGPWGTRAWRSGYSQDQQKFLDETRDMRKQLHDRRFELMELYRDRDADPAKVESLEKEVDALQEKLWEAADGIKTRPGYGPGCGNCLDEPRGWRGRGRYGGDCRGAGSCGYQQASRGCTPGYGRMW